MEFVKKQFGISVNDDIADAICIGFSAVGGVIKESQVITTDDGFEFAWEIFGQTMQIDFSQFLYYIEGNEYYFL